MSATYCNGIYTIQSSYFNRTTNLDDGLSVLASEVRLFKFPYFQSDAEAIRNRSVEGVKAISVTSTLKALE